MRFSVSPKCRGIREAFQALLAHKFLVFVNLLVLNQRRIAVKHFRTFITLKHLRLMLRLVVVQLAQTFERFIAPFAAERQRRIPRIRVALHVTHQFVLAAVLLAANFARGLRRPTRVDVFDVGFQLGFQHPVANVALDAKAVVIILKKL